MYVFIDTIYVLFNGYLSLCFFISLCVQLCGFLTDVVIDQLPNLLDLKQFLSQLAVTDPVAPKNDLILEQVLQQMHTHIDYKFGVSDIFFLLINSFIQQRFIKLFKNLHC